MPMARIEGRTVMARYMSDITAHPTLSAEEERALAAGMQEADRDEFLRRLIHANLSFVINIARQYAHMGVPFEDLVGEGNLGLLEAARRFDPARGTRFITCAVWWIRRAIMRAVARRSAIVRLPRGQHRKVRRVLDAAARLSSRLGRPARREEISAEMGLQVGAVEAILMMRTREVALDAAAAPGSDTSLAELLTDGGDGDPEAILRRREARALIAATLPRLSTRERLVIEARFGVGDGRPRTLREVGALIGASREAARLIERQATAKLRRALLGRRSRRLSGSPAGRAPRSGRAPLLRARPRRVPHSSQFRAQAVTSPGDIPHTMPIGSDGAFDPGLRAAPEPERAGTTAG